MPPDRRLKVPAELADFLSHLPPPVKRKVRGGLDAILKNPHEGKPLRAELTGLSSLAVGRFRIIYRPGDSLLEIVTIGPRATVYQEISRRLQQLP